MMDVALQQLAAATAARNSMDQFNSINNLNNLKSDAIAIARMIGSDVEMSTTPPKNESGSFEELQFNSQPIPSTPTNLHPPTLQTQQSRQAQASIDFEKEVSTLESAIRTQKVSSMNAKTAITFDQLRLVHAIGKSLGNGKDAFYDRICRAADIQRASLKNRLKQNKEKFIQKSTADFPPSILDLMKKYPPPPKYAQYALNPINTPQPQLEKPNEPSFDPFSLAFDQSISNLTTPVGNAFLPQGGVSFPAFVKTEIIEAGEPVLTQEDRELQERDKIPAQRMMQLLQLGFSFEDMKTINDMYHSYAEMARRENVADIRGQFSNFLSTSIPEKLKLIGIAYNMLEMGYSSTAIAPYLTSERRKRQTSELSGGDDSNQGDSSVKRQCLEDIDERS